MFLHRKVLRDNKQNLPNSSNFRFTQFIYHLLVRMQNCYGKQYGSLKVVKIELPHDPTSRCLSKRIEISIKEILTSSCLLGH